MSGLLVKSTLIMNENLELMNERGINVPVVLGGAALTRRYVEDDLKSLYKGALFYARDAFAGLHTMDLLTGSGAHAEPAAAKAVAANAGAGNGSSVASEAEEADDLVGEDAKLGVRAARARPRGVLKSREAAAHTARSDVHPDAPIPRAPFYGSRVVERHPARRGLRFVNETALFKGQWQFKQGRRPAEEYRALVEEKVRPVYEELKARSEREGLLVPQVVYGYFPCQSEGNDLIVYHEDGQTERMRFTFPRQPAGKRLCLADYFASKESGRVDTVAFHLVTVGRRASEYAQELFSRTTTPTTSTSTASGSSRPRRWRSFGTSASARSWALPGATPPRCRNSSTRAIRARASASAIRPAPTSKTRRSSSSCWSPSASASS